MDDDFLYFVGYTLNGGVLTLFGMALGVSLAYAFIRSATDVFYWARSKIPVSWNL